MVGKIKIEISKEVREKIMKTFGVSNQMVVNAMNYSGNGRGETELAKRIRRMAMKNGGRRMAYLPAFETAYTHNGIMTQEFDNGAKLIADMHSGEVKVIDPKGVVRERVENASIPQLYVMQNVAAGF